MVKIQTRYDRKRGCGWRKKGGLYLVSGGLAAPCGKLPIPLTVCPTCGHGIKPSRGWTWINGTELVKDLSCRFEDAAHHAICPMNGDPSRVGLLWIGEKFYKTTTDFTREAAALGISRCVAAIPNDFKLGETWVWFDHRKAISELCKTCNGTGKHKGIEEMRLQCDDCDGEGWLYTPAIFHAFKPTAIEYVVKGTESQEELERLAKRGITPIRIEKSGETKELIGNYSENENG